MTKKPSKKKSSPKAAPRVRKTSDDKTSDNAVLESALETALTGLLAAVEAGATDRRKELLARVAGSIAAGLVTSPSPAIASPKGMATAAVDIAEEILQRVGIGEVDAQAHAAPAPSGDHADVGAAS